MIPWWLVGATVVGVILLKRDDLEGLAMGKRIYRADRALGVHRDLSKFLEWWNVNGDFPLLVTDGLRTDAAQQAQLYAAGKTKAATLAQTPHGHGMALDVVPYEPVSGVALWNDDGKWATLGRVVDAFGLVWGGHWKFVDKPHIEVPGWQNTPLGAKS